LEKQKVTIECKNFKILNKVANSLFVAYSVRFDEIFDLLIDEILLEEVK
jgi:hypothetical protein